MWRAKYLVRAADCELERARGARVCAEILRGETVRGDGARRRRYERALWARRHTMPNERVCAASLSHAPAVMYWGCNASIEHYLRFVHIHNIGVQPSCPPSPAARSTTPTARPRPLPSMPLVVLSYRHILPSHTYELFLQPLLRWPRAVPAAARVRRRDAASHLRAASRQRRSRS